MTRYVPRHYSLPMRVLYRALVQPDGCWLWTGAVDKNSGYGRLGVRGQMWLAHRASYESFVGRIPEGLLLDHLCRVRHCVNPRHLEPVTCLENVQRSPIHHGAKTHCPQGHPFDGLNTRHYQGRRYCIACQHAHSAARYAARKAAAA